LLLRQVHGHDSVALQRGRESSRLLDEHASRILKVLGRGNSGYLSKPDNSLSKRDTNGNERLNARELLRCAAEVSFEVAAKVGLAGVAQGRSDLFVGQALGQERRREAHSLAHDPGLGCRVELFAETPLKRAHVQPDMYRDSFHAEPLLYDHSPKFVRFGKMCSHIINTFETALIFQESAKFFLGRSARARYKTMHGP